MINSPSNNRDTLIVKAAANQHVESRDDVAISLANVCKTYRLYDSRLDRLKEAIHPLNRAYHTDFHALDDISLVIRKGESVGIIGRNGSGKSTLLKTISGVLTPTTGTVTVNGKTSALLELGAGFNPQLTGMENIYFNGTLLGYTKREIDERIDDILAFADIGDFIHQKVQTYSSGMFVRLAFAVATSIDPDILIIDEALAVGDALIQKKCMDRMYDFKKAGKTILFVSHALESLKSFVDRGIVMNNGKVHFDGPSEKSITEYLKLLFPKKTTQAPPVKKPTETDAKTANSYALIVSPESSSTDSTFGAGGAAIEKVSITGLIAPNIFSGNDSLSIEVSYAWEPEFITSLLQEHDLDDNLLFGLSFENVKGITISGFSTSFADPDAVDVKPSSSQCCRFRFTVELPELVAGHYFLTLGISLGRQQKHIPLKRYRNLIQLKCVPNRDYIYGLMTFPMTITKLAETPN